MDAHEFDVITRALGASRSRRQAIRAFAGGALGLAAATVGFREASASARKRADGVVCSKNADCLSDFCADKDETGRRVCDEPVQPCSLVHSQC